MTQWRCPECGSPRVTILNDILLCLHCGAQEYLYDYPNAIDSGYLPDKETPEEKPEKPRPAPRDELQQLRGQVIYLQNKLNYHLDKKREEMYE